MIQNNTIINGDCLEVMKDINDQSINMILCDLPYGTTNNKWDIIIPFDKLWERYNRILRENGVVVLTTSQPFTSMAVISNLADFRYEWIWEKSIGSGQLNIKHRPLLVHESILVFYKKLPTYNPQMTEGKPYTINRKASEFKDANYGKQKDVLIQNKGLRYPKSVIKIGNPRIKNGHPTQKPLEVFEYFIKTYTNEGDLVLDNCIGSGTTAEVCIKTNRNFIGIELDKIYYDIAIERIKHDKGY